MGSEVRFHSSTNSSVTRTTVHCVFLGWEWNGIENWVWRVVQSHVYKYIIILLIVLSVSSVCYCIVRSCCVSYTLGWQCTSVNSAALAQISYAAAASLVRSCVMVSLWMNHYEFISFIEYFLDIFDRFFLKRDNMDYHFTYLTVKYIRDKLSIFQTGFSSC